MAENNKKILQKYVTELKVYNTYPGDNIPTNCNSVTFINTGEMYAVIDGYQLTTGQSLTIQGNIDEINVHNYSLRFYKDPLIPGAQITELTVIRKKYV